MLRSPSHESDLSSLASGSANHHRVSFVTNNKSSLGGGLAGTHSPRRPTNIPEIFWLEEDGGNHLLKSCAKLSDAVGIPKSFSTSDITEAVNEKPVDHLRPFVSELALCSFQRCGFLADYPNRLEQTSRSCSTWVAVGELASQLPSPHGTTHSINSLQFSNNALSASNVPVQQQGQTHTAPFSTVDLIRNINKKVRKNYIRRKIMMTYRALERMSQSEFNLDRLVAAANEQLEEKKRIKKRGASPGPTELVVPNLNALVVTEEEQQKKTDEKEPDKTSAIEPAASSSGGGGATMNIGEPTADQQVHLPRSMKLGHGLTKNMTMCDIELERGRSLSKYERNMMIFNWLHSLVLPLPEADPPI